MEAADAVARALAPSVLARPIAAELGLAVDGVQAALELLAQGVHPPFIARYRRERTGGIGIAELERIQTRAANAAQFEFKREALRRELAERQLLNDEVSEQLAAAQEIAALDDLRLLFKKRKKGPAVKARAHGLDALAAEVWALGRVGAERDDTTKTPRVIAEAHVSEAYPTADDVLQAVRTLCAEDLSSRPNLRAALRRLMLEHGTIVAQPNPDKKDKLGRYKSVQHANESCATIAPQRLLPLLRAEREHAIVVTFDVPESLVLESLGGLLAIDGSSPFGALLLESLSETWHQHLQRSTGLAVRDVLKRRADALGIEHFCETLRPMLMAPRLGQVPVLAIDPGHQQGCRVVVVDGEGALLADDHVFPLQPKLQVPQAKARIAELCREHGVVAIAVGTGAGGRDVERLCRELVAEERPELVVAAQDTDAAGLFASSRGGKQEFSAKDVALRRAVSLARRLQDPLFELSKIDPRKLGLGQHQHEVDQNELRDALEQVLASCLNLAGVDLNRIDAERLARIAGFSPAIARAVVSYREGHGPFRQRSELLDVPGMAGKSFEQAAGFVRIHGGIQPLDATAIHPERYAQVTAMARDLGVTVQDLLGRRDLVDRIRSQAERYIGRPGVSGEPLGAATMEQVLAELADPHPDARPAFTAVHFDPGLREFSDLQVGMELEGVITHLASFGAFVDVGLGQEGLVHISELTHEYVTNPAEAVHVGERVRGRVIEINPDRKRFSLSLKALQAKPERPAPAANRPAAQARPPRTNDEDRKRRKPDKPDKRGGRPIKDRRDPDRVLNFKLDLSDLVERLQKQR